jgi:hypothetical protein
MNHALLTGLALLIVDSAKLRGNLVRLATEMFAASASACRVCAGGSRQASPRSRLGRTVRKAGMPTGLGRHSIELADTVTR